jgi:uncharacterized protein with HEPN domain
MPPRSVILRLEDIAEAAERIREVAGGQSLDEFEANWQGQWLVERGIEIVSEASRHLPADLKDRHPEIPWRNVAGIGNILRHGYETISAPVLFKLVQDDLRKLEAVCRAELINLKRL